MKFPMFFVLVAGLGFAMLSANPGQADTLLWRVESEHPNIVSVEFYSQDFNRAWPGGGEVYVIKDYNTHSYNLECSTGETICMGAWVRGASSSYWGVGQNDTYGCSACCYVCGAGDTGTQRLNQ